jgi:putative tricarboxylic transport membrane protein
MPHMGYIQDVDSDPMSAQPQHETPIAPGRNIDPEQPTESRLLRTRLLAAAPYIITVVAAVLFLIKVEQFEFDHVPGRIGPDAWPKLILLLAITAGAWGILKTFLFDAASSNGAAKQADLTASDTGQPDTAYIDEPEIHPARVWATLAGTLAYLWILHYLGFFIGTFIFLAFVIYTGGYRKFTWLFFISLLGSLFFMTIFVRVVYVSLPIGIEPFSTVSLALLALLNL